jgi:hypothetical protein
MGASAQKNRLANQFVRLSFIRRLQWGVMQRSFKQKQTVQKQAVFLIVQSELD